MNPTTKRVPVASLHFDPANVRVHDSKNLEAIRSSLKEFGQVEPLVVQKGSGKVIGGNGRLAALRELGVAEVNIVEVEANDVQAAALGIALNRTGELAKWDDEGLFRMLKVLEVSDVGLASMGFDSADLAALALEVDESSFPELPLGGKGAVETMTFVLSNDQAETVRRALIRAKAEGSGVATEENKNSNGNALAFACAAFVNG